MYELKKHETYHLYKPDYKGTALVFNLLSYPPSDSKNMVLKQSIGTKVPSTRSFKNKNTQNSA